MSTATPQPPLPRQPLGKTFIVAISLLGVFALVQLIAVIAHVLPMARRQLIETTSRPAPTPTIQATPDAQAMQQQQQAFRPAGPSVVDGVKIQRLLAEADRNYRVGQIDEALKFVEEAESLQPEDPAVMWRKAQILEKLDEPAQAVAALEITLASPGLPPQVRAEAERKYDQLSRLIDSGTLAPGTAKSTKAAPLATGGEGELRENGIQPGASLGIVEIRERDTKPGTKSFLVAIKGREGAQIDVKAFELRVFFYEQSEEGDVTITDSSVMQQWLSQPINWSENEPELVEIHYPLPDETQGLKYFGYIVALYYNGELQDFRSNPAKLAQDHPPLLYSKQNTTE